MRSLLTCLVLTHAVAGVFAQPVQTFKKRYGTSGDDEARVVEVLADGSFLVAGATNGGLGGQDALLMKITAAGNLEWTKALGGSGTDIFVNLLPCTDGNYLAIGETNSLGSGAIDIYVVKFTTTGNVLWERALGGSASEEAGGACEVADGYVITGSTLSFGAGFWDMYMTKLDLSGNSLWSSVWGQGGGDKLGECLPDGAGGVWTGGLYFVGGANIHDAPVLRVNASGNAVYTQRVSTVENDNGYFLAPGGSSFVVSGTTFSYTNGAQQQPWMHALNASGGLVWSKRYLIPAGNYMIHAEDCPDGGFVFAPTSLNADVSFGYLVKTDANGNIVWAKTHTLQGNGRLRHAQPTPDGGYVAAGFTSGSGRDVILIKTDAQGLVQDCCPEDAPITAVAVTPSLAAMSLQSNSGPSVSSPTGGENLPSLNETDICTGTPCCVTDAGSMAPQTLTVCTNATAVFSHNNDEELDANDLLQFILFSNPADTLGSIVATSITPAFTFNLATMQTGVTYYVAAIAGNNEGGNVDPDDPCLDISGAAQLTWRPLPTVLLSLNEPDLCPGECTVVNAVFTGTPPYVLTVSIPGTGDQVYNFNSNTGGFVVCVPAGAAPGGWKVEAVALQDLFCSCP